MGRTREIWKARDGDVSFGLRGGPARIPNLVATVEYMAESGMAPEWLRVMDWRSYNHNELSDAEIARLEAAFGAFFASKTRRELYQEALRRRIMLAPCNDAREILAQPQLRSRELFTTLEYPELGASVRPGGLDSPDPELAAHLLTAFADEAARLLLADPERYPAERMLELARWFLRAVPRA